MSRFFLVFFFIFLFRVEYGECGVGSNDTIQPDPNLHAGQLRNGFSYYIRNCKAPEGKVLIYLVVKSGSVFEDSDQTEVAHVTEHMAFTKTKHFSNVWAFFDSLGLRRGNDVNAFTGVCHTSFFFSVPSEKAKMISRSILLARDMSQGIILDSVGIDRERGVVLAELRRAGGSFQRIRDIYYPQVLGNSLYGRKFKDTEERRNSIENFDYGVLRRFYRDWYRPDLQAIIVVGDVDVISVEDEVKRLFCDLEMPEVVRPNIRCDSILLEDDCRYVVASDSEKGNVEVQIFNKIEKIICTDFNGYRRLIISELFNEIVAQRFDRLLPYYNLPFHTIQCSLQRGVYPDADVIQTYVDVKSMEIKKSLIIAIGQLERIRRFGFTEAELNRAKEYMLRTKLNSVEETSLMYASRYQQNFISGSLCPDMKVEQRMLIRILSEIDLNEVNSSVMSWLSDVNRKFVFLAPESELNCIPSEEDVNEWVKDVSVNDRVKEDDDEAVSLDFNFTSHNNEVRKVNILGDGVSEIILSNRIKVIFKSVRDGSGNIQMHATRQGGAKNYFNSDYFNALYSADIVSHSGVLNLNKFQLKKYLDGKGIELSPYVYEDQVGIRGHSPRDQFESLLQLMYLYFVSPRKDLEAFNDWIESQRELARFNRQDVNLVFRKLTDSIVYGNVDRASMFSNHLDAVDLDASFNLYNHLFSDASAFTFVVVGDVDLNEVQPLLTKYFSGFPSRGVALNKQDVTSAVKSMRTSKRNVLCSSLVKDKAMVRIYFNKDYKSTRRGDVVLKLLNEILAKSLTRRLRDLEGATYAVHSHVGYTSNECRFSISFECKPKDTANLILAVHQEIDRIKYSLGSDMLNEGIRSELVRVASEEKSSAFWLNYLSLRAKDPNRRIDISDRKSLLSKVKKDELEIVAKIFLDMANCKEIFLVPCDN